MPVPPIDLLLNLVPDAPSPVLTHLQTHPSLASQQDSHGYSLLHAAASYEHASLVRALITDFHVDPNLPDEDDETALFSVETLTMAKLLLDLGTDASRRNAEGQTVAEKFEAEGEYPEIVAFLKGGEGEGEGGSGSGGASTNANGEGRAGESEGANGHGVNGNGVGEGEDRRPPPLPEGIKINVGTMSDEEVGSEPDPEFRRRIEELAARGDFEGEEGQRELRRLVEEVVSGISEEGEGRGSGTRRRLG